MLSEAIACVARGSAHLSPTSPANVRSTVKYPGDADDANALVDASRRSSVVSDTRVKEMMQSVSIEARMLPETTAAGEVGRLVQFCSVRGQE